MLAMLPRLASSRPVAYSRRRADERPSPPWIDPASPSREKSVQPTEPLMMIGRPIRGMIGAAVLAIAAQPGATPARADSPFPDKNLEAAVRAVLKHEPNVELTDEKLRNVYILEAPGKEIKDLTGLEKCKNLALLRLSKNQVADLKAIQDLKNLESLDLADNAIVDLAPLKELKGLQYLELSNNKIVDLAPLGGLTSLSALYLGGNQVKDVGPLAPLVKLASLSLGKNQIKDVSVLAKLEKLSTLDLRENQIEDVAPLAKQTEIKLLLIERNQIKDLAPLVEAAKADAAGPKLFAPYLRLYLDGNPLSESSRSAQLEALKAAGVRIEG